jgi:hypothetical protein
VSSCKRQTSRLSQAAELSRRAVVKDPP